MRQWTYQVVYLTGAPATGKSTLAYALRERARSVIVFSYAEVLRRHIERRLARPVPQRAVREGSATLISPEDVERADAELQDLVARERGKSHIVVDSHAVTKETYGFRATPFSFQQLRAINPTVIIVLYVRSGEAMRRIQSDPQGRPLPSHFEADFHTGLQATVALIYGVCLGIPIYFVDSERPQEELVVKLCEHLRIKNA